MDMVAARTCEEGTTLGPLSVKHCEHLM